jgi:hypothetical protein
MWPWRPSTVALIENLPRLEHSILRRTGALLPGKATRWSWNPTHGPSIKVTGAEGAFTIDDAVRVVLRGRFMVCPTCGQLCRYLLLRRGWKCRCCSGADYAVRHTWRTNPAVHRRRKLLRALAREPVLSLKASAMRYQLARIDQAILMMLRDAYRRADSAHR